MKDTPTPRSREEWRRIQRLPDGSYSSKVTYGELAHGMSNFAEQLERELIAMTEQRDGLQSGIDYASEQLHKVREQRDRLAEALRMITTFDYSDLQCDNGHGARYVATEALQSLTPTQTEQTKL